MYGVCTVSIQLKNTDLANPSCYKHAAEGGMSHEGVSPSGGPPCVQQVGPQGAGQAKG